MKQMYKNRLRNVMFVTCGPPPAIMSNNAKRKVILWFLLRMF